MLNPIIYAFTIEEFKQTMVAILTIFWRIPHLILPNIIRQPTNINHSRIPRQCAYLLTQKHLKKTIPKYGPQKPAFLKKYKLKDSKYLKCHEDFISFNTETIIREETILMPNNGDSNNGETMIAPLLLPTTTNPLKCFEYTINESPIKNKDESNIQQDKFELKLEFDHGGSPNGEFIFEEYTLSI